MKVKVIGTSCTWFKRNNSSYVIDENIIFDTPEGSFKDIANYMNVMNTKCVLITHFHTDHFPDLHIIATEIMRHGKRHGRTEKLRVYGPKGILERLVSLNRLLFAGPDECDPEQLCEAIDFVEVFDGFEFEEGEYKITAYKVEHGNPETYGFVFEDKSGKTVSFSADTTVCDNLHKMLEKSDFAFVEMASVNEHKTHISINDFEGLLKKYKNVKIYPVHTCDKCQEYAVEHGFNVLNDGDLLEL